MFTSSGGAVFWKLFKQTCINQSIIKSEFITLDKIGKEAKWLSKFLEDIPCWEIGTCDYYTL